MQTALSDKNVMSALQIDKEVYLEKLRETQKETIYSYMD